jgi:hypothetical protein
VKKGVKAIDHILFEQVMAFIKRIEKENAHLPLGFELGVARTSYDDKLMLFDIEVIHTIDTDNLNSQRVRWSPHDKNVMGSRANHTFKDVSMPFLKKTIIANTIVQLLALLGDADEAFWRDLGKVVNMPRLGDSQPTIKEIMGVFLAHDMYKGYPSRKFLSEYLTLLAEKKGGDDSTATLENCTSAEVDKVFKNYTVNRLSQNPRRIDKSVSVNSVELMWSSDNLLESITDMNQIPSIMMGSIAWVFQVDQPDLLFSTCANMFSQITGLIFKNKPELPTKDRRPSTMGDESSYLLMRDFFVMVMDVLFRMYLKKIGHSDQEIIGMLSENSTEVFKILGAGLRLDLTECMKVDPENFKRAAWANYTDFKTMYGEVFLDNILYIAKAVIFVQFFPHSQQLKL